MQRPGLRPQCEVGAFTCSFSFPYGGIIELPRGQFIPTDWNKDPQSLSTKYKHKLSPGKQYNMIVLAIDNNIIVTISQRNGDSFTLDFPSVEYVEVTPSGVPAINNHQVETN